MHTQRPRRRYFYALRGRNHSSRKATMPEQEELYDRLAKALAEAEMPHRTPDELSDPMAVAEFVNAILKRCREVVHHEISRG